MRKSEIPRDHSDHRFDTLIEKRFPNAYKYIFIQEIDPEIDKKNIFNLIRTIDYKKEEDDENAGFKSIKIFGIRTGRYILEISARDNELSVLYDSHFRYNARYYKEDGGSLEVDAFLTKRNGKIRHPYIPHLTQLAEATFEYFTRRGMTVNTIPGIWPTSFNHRKNVNFYAFQDALSRGLSPEQAIFETPQGKIMKKFCFTKCVFGKDNSPPDYKNGVEVYFNRE